MVAVKRVKYTVRPISAWAPLQILLRTLRLIWSLDLFRQAALHYERQEVKKGECWWKGSAEKEGKAKEKK